MVAVVQRVTGASVCVDGREVSRIGPGAVVLLGVARGDTRASAERFAARIHALRYFEDGEGRLNRALAEVQGQVLVVSQFTLLGDCRRGRRPGYGRAAPAAEAAPLVDAFAEALRRCGAPVACGVFGAHMRLALENDGPVTLIVDDRAD